MKLSDIYIQIILIILSFPVGRLLKSINYMSFYQTLFFSFAIAMLIPLRIEKERQNKKLIKRAKLYFPRFNFEMLKIYSRRWAKKYKALQIKQIILYRYNTENQEKGMVRFNNIVTARKYAIVFIYPRHIKLNSSLLEFYPMVEDTATISAAKEIIYAEQYAPQGRHRLFDQTFPIDVYAQTPNQDYFREWTFLLLKSGSPIDNPNLYKNESVILWQRNLWGNMLNKIKNI